MRKKKRPGKGRKKRIVREDRPMRIKKLAKKKTVSYVKNKLLKMRKPVWPQPKPNKTLQQKSLHAKKKSADRRSFEIQRSVSSVRDSSVRQWIKKELN